MSFILDCDAAYEDIMAALILLNNSDLKAVTVTYGESNTPIGALNIERVCRFIAPNKNIKVAYGQNKALDHHGTPFPEFINIESDTILESTHVPDIEESLCSDDAVTTIYQTLMENEEPTTIVATGPLTNIALLLSNHPDCISKIKNVVIMGGAVNTKGNIDDLRNDLNNDVAEWNIFADPLAAKLVFETKGLQINLVPLDITKQMPMTKEFVNKIESTTNPSLKLVADMLGALRKGMGEEKFYNNLQFWDSLSAMIALKPSMAEFSNNQSITIDLETGQTCLDKIKNINNATVNVALKLNNVEEAYYRFIQLVSKDNILIDTHSNDAKIDFMYLRDRQLRTVSSSIQTEALGDFFQSFPNPENENSKYHVYLAGPMVFYKEPMKIADEIKQELIAVDNRFIGWFPMDNQIPNFKQDRQTAIKIAEENWKMVDNAQIILANMRPWHGPSMDVGTVAELSAAAAHDRSGNKPILIVGYYEKGIEPCFSDRVIASQGKENIENLTDGRLLDSNGCFVEYFGPEMRDNLMIDEAIQSTGGAVFGSRIEAIQALPDDLIKFRLLRLFSSFL